MIGHFSVENMVYMNGEAILLKTINSLICTLESLGKLTKMINSNVFLKIVK